MVPTIVKENPLKSLAAFLSSVTVVLSAAFTLDTRYAHAAEVEKIERQTAKQLQEMQRGALDDKVFELEIRKSARPRDWTKTDQLMLDRYNKRLEEVDRQRESSRREKD